MRFWKIISFPFRRGPRRPLSAYQPQVPEPRETVALGLEAIDMQLVKNVQKRNFALERVSAFRVPSRRRISFLENVDAEVSPLADDETYAARYHSAFIEKKGTD
ncbi:MAG: hypothetical protein AAF636_15090 [Pseudomonadota bacterium]